MEKKNSIFGIISLCLAVTDLLACLFVFNTNETVQRFLLLWIPLAAAIVGVIGLFQPATSRVAAGFGILAASIPLAFVLLMLWAFSHGGFNPAFK